MKIINDKKYKDIRRVVEVAVSCKTSYHCESTLNMLRNYVKMYKIESGFMMDLCIAIHKYLLDTCEHITYGEHYPEWNKTDCWTHYPDINKYLKPYLGVYIKNY